MVKSKNHTNRNLTFKSHRNGIKKPKNWKLKTHSLKFRGFKGMDPVFRRNQRYAKLGMKKKKAAEKQKRLADRRKNKGKKQANKGAKQEKKDTVTTTKK